MSSGQLTIPNKPIITRVDPKLGEALTAVETYVNENLNATPGNAKAAPPTTLANPTQRPG